MKRKDTIYLYLMEHVGEYCSGEKLAKEFGISRAAIWKAIETLKKDYNIPIVSHKKLGYYIPEGADILTVDAVKENLHTVQLGKSIEKYTTVSSTNTVCKEKIEKDILHGTVILADEQTAGRGRMGRVFCSPMNTGLYLSVFLCKGMSMPTAQQITCCTAVAVAEAIEFLYGLSVQIKWVNDLYYNGKKLCGILTEAAWNCEDGKIEHMIVGIGVNVRQTAQNMPPLLAETITSLEECGCMHVKRAELAAKILDCLEEQLMRLPERHFLNAYRNRSCLTGKRVTAKQGGQMINGIVEGIADDGGLQLKTDAGEILVLQSGEVTLHTQETI